MKQGQDSGKESQEANAGKKKEKGKGYRVTYEKIKYRGPMPDEYALPDWIEECDGSEVPIITPEPDEAGKEQLAKSDRDALAELEKALGEIPAVQEVMSKIVGFRVKSNRISQLGLFNMHLTALPGVLGKLRGLTKLYLSANDFGSFPGVITTLAGLQSLVLSNNKLKTLPPSFGNLRSLKILSLRTSGTCGTLRHYC